MSDWIILKTTLVNKKNVPSCNNSNDQPIELLCLVKVLALAD